MSLPEIVRKLSRSWSQGLFIVAAVTAASVLTLVSLRDFQREAVPPENRPIQSHVAGYVSSNACRACHPGNYASWHASFHRTMTQVATPQSLPPDMDGLELTHDGREYKAERSGDKFFMRTRTEGGSYGEAQQVVLVTGSHNLQILWLETGQGRTLQQFPFGYIVAEKMWAPVNATFLLPPDMKEYYSTGAWNGACMDCHVTQGQSRFVSGFKWDSHVAEFGIACEACHSEGSEHIERNRNPLRRFKIHLTTRSDPTVTNPANLKGPESGLACGQCHSVWAFNDMPDKIDFNQHGAAFRPGAGDLSQRFVRSAQRAGSPRTKRFHSSDRAGFFSQSILGRWNDSRDRARIQRRAGVALFSRRRILLHLLPRNAPRFARSNRCKNLGAHRSVETENGFGLCLFAMSQRHDRETRRAHAS